MHLWISHLLGPRIMNDKQYFLKKQKFKKKKLNSPEYQNTIMTIKSLISEKTLDGYSTSNDDSSKSEEQK